MKPLPKKSKPVKAATKDSRSNVAVRGERVSYNDDYSDKAGKTDVMEFKKKAKGLLKQISEGNDNEATTLDIAKTLLRSIVGAMHNYEKSLKNGSGRDAYAYVALCDMVLKLNNELRALQDRTAMSQLIMHDIIRPELESMAHKITASVNLAKVKMPKNTPDHVLDQMEMTKKGASDAISQMYSRTSMQLSKYFGGNGNGAVTLDLEGEKDDR